MINGSAQKNPQRVNKSEPKATRGYPPSPMEVKKNPVAENCWNTMCQQLDEMGLLVTSDLYVLQVAVMSYAKMIEIDKELGGKVTMENSKGELVSHPAAMHYHRFQTMFVRCLGELGLTPSSRLRLHAPDPDKDADDFQKWLQSTGGAS
jgi:P27 family predicted phage terminase small subunit